MDGDARLLQPVARRCSVPCLALEFGTVFFVPLRPLLGFLVGAVLLGGCLLPSTDELSGEPSKAPATVASCQALKLSAPATPDGFQTIDPDGSGPIAPFRAWCDMTTDGGGWMLVDATMIADETAAQTTVVRSADGNGGLIARVYVNSQGCGSGQAKSRHRMIFGDKVKWSRIRFKETFAGNAGCWHVFGGVENDGLDPNLEPYDPANDVLRDAVKMGGSLGDAFDGKTVRCDNDADNFWQADDNRIRSATVILRRKDATLPAGVSTGADCGSSGPGTTSLTWFEYRAIYVR